jgi:hypothetical protein
MCKPFMTGTKYFRPKKHILSAAEHGIKRIRCLVLPCVMAVFLLFSVMLPLTVQTAGAATAEETALAAIDADVAAGGNIATIIQNAVAAGLSVERAVQEIVARGAEPGAVVYVAIQAGYSPTAVVQGATVALTNMGLSDASFQAQMTRIDSTALQAGATQAQVSAGLSNAGVSATVISNAASQAAASPAPVFGYTAPTPVTSLTGAFIPTLPVTVTGTIVASPTKPKK